MAKNIYVDFKVSVWKRINFDTLSPNDLVRAKKMVKEGVDMITIIEEFDLEIIEVYSSMEDLSLEDNGYNATVELYEENKQIWDNGKRTPQ